MVWSFLLSGITHVDKVWVLQGIASGSRLGMQVGECVSATLNCRSAYARPALIDNFLLEEIKFDCVAGPFSSPPIEGLHISRFGIIPKATPGKFRLITDLSFPQGHSVNDLVPDAEAQVAYDSIPQAQDMLTKVGWGGGLTWQSSILSEPIVSCLSTLPSVSF